MGYTLIVNKFSGTHLKQIPGREQVPAERVMQVHNTIHKLT